MDANSQQQKNRDNILSLLNVAIEALVLAKDASNVTPAKVVYNSVSVLLTMIRVCLLLFSGGLQAHVYPGLHGQKCRLRQSRAGLR